MLSHPCENFNMQSDLGHRHAWAVLPTIGKFDISLEFIVYIVLEFGRSKIQVTISVCVYWSVSKGFFTRHKLRSCSGMKTRIMWRRLWARFRRSPNQRKSFQGEPDYPSDKLIVGLPSRPSVEGDVVRLVRKSSGIRHHGQNRTQLKFKSLDRHMNDTLFCYQILSDLVLLRGLIYIL